MIKTFEEALNACDADIQIKFSYLDNLLCEIDDAIYENFEELQKVEIDEQIAELLDDKKLDFKANERRFRLKKELEQLELKYNAVEYLYDDMTLKILANID